MTDEIAVRAALDEIGTLIEQRRWDLADARLDAISPRFEPILAVTFTLPADPSDGAREVVATATDLRRVFLEHRAAIDGDHSIGLDPAPAYTVLRETPSETAAEAQLDGRLVVGTELSGDELGAVLRDYLAEARTREGWRRHPHTTDIYAYAYATEADANGSGGRWLAMMTWAAERAEPNITLSAERMAAAAAGPEDHDGLREDERRAIYAELMRGDAAALERASSPDDYVAATHANERAVASRHAVPVETVRAIGIEGVSRGW